VRVQCRRVRDHHPARFAALESHKDTGALQLVHDTASRLYPSFNLRWINGVLPCWVITTNFAASSNMLSRSPLSAQWMWSFAQPYTLIGPLVWDPRSWLTTDLPLFLLYASLFVPVFRGRNMRDVAACPGPRTGGGYGLSYGRSQRSRKEEQG